MLITSYLVKSRHGIYYLRLQRNGADRRISLRTRDPASAIAAAYRFGATISGMKNNDQRNFELEVTPGGGIKVKTDGTAADNAAALEALEKLKQIEIEKQKTRVRDALNLDTTAIVKQVLASSANSQTSLSLKKICLRDAITEYRPSLEKSKQADKSKKMALSTLNDLSAKLGADFDLSQLSDEVIEDQWLGPRLNEVAATTAKRDLSFIRAFVAWAADKKRMYCPAPLELSLDAKGGHREYFEANDLKVIFKALPAAANKPYKLWLPLIALYSGARVGEIAAIRTDGIYKKAGIDALFLPGTKTDSSPRHIPIHDDLIRLGFLEYAATRASAKQEFLFDITHSSANGPGGEPSKWFGRFIREAGITDKTKVFHSFRPTIVDHLRQHGAPFEPRCQFVGHDAGGGVHNKVYGREPFGLQMLKSEVVDKIDWHKFCGWSLDFDVLKTKADEFTAYCALT